MSPARSLYIHVPFCSRKCAYCDFYSVAADTDRAEGFLSMLGRELQRSIDDGVLDPSSIDTLYIGGGTPSVLSAARWEKLAQTLRRALCLSATCEFTVECNPESVTGQHLDLWHAAGVNRLSLGVQSLDDNELKLLGRPHDASRARAALEELAGGPVGSLSVDIMYGLPGQDLSTLVKTLSALVSHPGIQHISAYELTPNTTAPLFASASLPDDDVICDMNRALVSVLAGAGFRRYEVSNFARPGHESRHNRHYWSHAPYVGLGPAAHSWVPPTRYANHADLDTWCLLLETGRPPRRYTETIDKEKLAREMVFLGLRTAAGIDENLFEEKTSLRFNEGRREPLLRQLQEENYIRHAGTRWYLTDEGMLRADGIASRMI